MLRFFTRSFLTLLGCVLSGGAAMAVPKADALNGLGVQMANGQNGDVAISLPMQIAISMTLLSVLPAILTCVTPFLRISIVLHFLRQALGTQSTPSNQVMIGLALFLSILVVRPVAEQMYTEGYVPMQEKRLSPEQAFTAGAKPLKEFLIRFARENDIKLFLEIGKHAPPKTPSDVELGVLVPAYILSELKAGFQIGAVIFLPFLIIDLVVASVTLSIGMVQLPPAMISAPFKILLFVLVDGWSLIIGSLVKSLMQ
jgi:flagellar biosynthesis protein FliP